MKSIHNHSDRKYVIGRGVEVLPGQSILVQDSVAEKLSHYEDLVIGEAVGASVSHAVSSVSEEVAPVSLLEEPQSLPKRGRRKS